MSCDCTQIVANFLHFKSVLSDYFRNMLLLEDISQKVKKVKKKWGFSGTTKLAQVFRSCKFGFRVLVPILTTYQKCRSLEFFATYDVLNDWPTCSVRVLNYVGWTQRFFTTLHVPVVFFETTCFDLTEDITPANLYL